MAFSAGLENLILQLLVPSNETLNQGFSTMREAFKDPNINIGLCECMTSSQNPEVRQYAAVLLRKKVVKARQWRKITPEMKRGLKDAVLQLFMKETHNDVRKAVTELIAAIAKHETVEGHWPEFMQLLNQCISSSNVTEKELGLYAMSIVTASAGLNFKPHLRSILPMFSKCLTDTSSIAIPFHTIVCLTNLVCCIGTDELNLFQNLIPTVVQVIQNLVTNDEEKACKALELFDVLLECEVAVIMPYIKMLITFCLQVATALSLQNAIRVKALAIIRWIIELKKKTILKHKLIVPLLNVLIPIMCQRSSVDPDSLFNDMEGDDSGYEDKQCPVYCAGQVIDVMALHLPPEKLLPPLMQHMETVLKSEDPFHRKAAYLAMAVVAEGCSEYIRNKGLKNYVKVICNGLKEENPIVRNPAFYCLEQYAEYLQPDINKFVDEIFPLLLQRFDATCQISPQGKRQDSRSLKYTFFAFDTFCANLGDEMGPYLPTVMERLLNLLSADVSSMTKEMTISTIGSVACASKKSFEPYFPVVIEHLKSFINNKTKCTTLQVEAIDTLSIIARSVSEETFMPMTRDCLNLGIQLIEEMDDPDIRRCVFMLFASVALILKDNMSEYLPTIIEHLMSSIKSTEGINLHYAEEENSSFNLFEDSEEDIEEKIGDQDEDDPDDEVTGLSVENAYMDEKESACSALKDMAVHSGLTFVPFVNTCFEEVIKVLDIPDADVRREALVCLGQFCVSLNAAFLKTNSLEYRLALSQKIAILLPKVFTLAREDIERVVVLGCLETIQEMADKIKGNFINESVLEFVALLIKDIFRKKLACQDDDDDDEELSEQEAEYDIMLFQYAGNIIPSLFKSAPTQQVIPHFAGLLPFLLPKSKRISMVSDKSFVIGIIAESVNFMEEGFARPYLNHLLPLFLRGMTDEEGEVRSNAVFGLGALVLNVTHSLYDQYPTLLQSLSNMLSKEESVRAKDNLCSALAKMITVNPSAVPMKEVFPAFLQCLPLEEDMEENAAVYKCLSQLHSMHCEEFYQNLPRILTILAKVLTTQELEEDTKTLIVNLVNSMAQEFPLDFQAILKTLPSENVLVLSRALCTV